MVFTKDSNSNTFGPCEDIFRKQAYKSYRMFKVVYVRDRFRAGLQSCRV